MIDAHAHIIARDHMAFPPVARRDAQIESILTQGFDAEKLIGEMASSSVDRALVVQRGQIYEHDNSYVCHAAEESSGRLHAVCAIDANSADSDTEARRWHRRGAIGFRLMARTNDKTFGWLDSASAHTLWQTATELALPMCVHFFPWNRVEGLARLERICDRFPVEQIVIDHLTNGPITSEQDAGIDDAVRRLADRPGISLKFTSIPLNGLAEKGIDAGAVLSPYVTLFGAERIMWGSDVTQSAGTYAEMVQKAREAVSSFSESVQQQLLGTTAARIYRLVA
jgi:predicted TIM-barrel fold metal-dependent hydrolase